MRRTSEEEKKNREDSDEDEEDSDTTSVASTNFSYYSINSTCSEKSRKQARLSNYAFCIQVRTLLMTMTVSQEREGIIRILRNLGGINVKGVLFSSIKVI